MRVVYDISVLGEGLYNRQARTGVSRVVDNLRLALADESDVDLSCCAFRSLENYTKILINTDAGGVSLCSPSRVLSDIATRVVGKIYPRQIASPGARLSSRFLNGLLRGVEFVSGGFNTGDLRGVDIFHSTYYPFPESIMGSQPFERFIMVHDLIPILYPEFCSRAQRRLCRETVECIGADDWVLANSESTKADLCDYAKLDPARVFVTPLAASDVFRRCTDSRQLAAVRERYAIPDSPYVLSVCTLEPRKNIDQVIRSFFELIQEQHVLDLNLVLVGINGWGFDRIYEEIDCAKDLRDRVIVTGYVADDDLPVLYSGAMMFVYPSFYEGFGLPPLEAMQCGVPVIASNTSSLPEVLGDAGIMVDPRDGKELCQAMWNIYSRPSLRDNLSIRSLERARLFSWQQTARLTLAAYYTALGR